MTNDNTTTEVQALRERLDALQSERDRLTERQTDLRADYIEAEGTARGLREALARGDKGVDAGTVAAAQPAANALAAAVATVDAELSTTNQAMARVEAELTDAEAAAKAAGLLTDADVEALILEYRERVDAVLFELADTIDANARLFDALRVDASQGTRGSNAPIRFHDAPEGERLITPHGTFGNPFVSFVLKETVNGAADRWAEPALDALRADDAAMAAAEAEGNARLRREQFEYFARSKGD